MNNLNKIINLELLSLFKTKIVNLIPTKVSDIENDLGYKTADTNTTYTLTKEGQMILLTGSDGTQNSVKDDTGSSAVDDVLEEMEGIRNEYNGLTTRVSNTEINVSNKSDLGHTHSAHDITTGILAIENGGTGDTAVDTTPIESSTRLITSGGVYQALSYKQKTISMGTSAPSGGINGDIYIQY